MKKLQMIWEHELMNIYVFTIDVLKVYGYIGT